MSEKVVETYGNTAAAEEDNGNFERDWRDQNFGGRALSTVAQEVAFNEKEMTIRQALKKYRKAVIWSLVISTCVIMEGESGFLTPASRTN
jgi:hypothetical protein